MNQICLICKQKSDRNKILRLKDILNELQVLSPNGRRINLPWGAQLRCRYGIACEHLQKVDMECRKIESQIEGYFDPLIASDDSALYYRVLRLLQGEFPAVYRYLVREKRNNK